MTDVGWHEKNPGESTVCWSNSKKPYKGTCLGLFFAYSTMEKLQIKPPFGRIIFTCIKHLKQIQVDHDTINPPKTSSGGYTPPKFNNISPLDNETSVFNRYIYYWTLVP